MVRMATANGPTTATDVVDIEVPGLDAHARVLLLKGCPAVLSLGRLVEEHKCSFVWNDDGAVLIDHAGNRHECVVRNYVPFLGQDYAFPAPSASADDLLDEIMPEGHDERDDDRPGVIHDLTHLRKRADCEACQAKVKMSPARRRDPLLRERPTGWAHTLLADHLSASDMKVEKQDFKMCLVLLCAGTSIGDVIPVKSKSALHTVMALREFYAEDQFYFFYSDNAPELKSAASNEMMLHLTSTPNRPQSNGVIERFIQLVIDGARCLLHQSGLPLRYWTLAARAFCHGRNISLAAFHGHTPWKAKHGEEFKGALIPFGAKVTFRPFRPPGHKGPKFAPRSEFGLFAGYFLQPGGLWKGEYLVISFEQLIKATGRIEVKRVRECALVPGPVTFPLKTVRDIQIDEDLREASERLEQSDPFVEGDLLELEDGGSLPDDENDGAKTPTGEEVDPPLEDSAANDGLDPSEGIPLRIPRASRIYIPRVGPPAPPTKRELRDDLPVEFQAENPKMPGSKIYAAYERYKTAKTVAEARELGATKAMIRYDIDKGYASCSVTPTVVVLALAATFAPLVEAWCAEDSELGRVGELRGRRVIRYTAADDLSNPDTIKRALSDIRTRSGVHLHGSIPCTPWTAWQRINLSQAAQETRDRILTEREVSLGYVRTFARLGKAALARGGSISFEWPRHCDGWKEDAVTAMLKELKLEPVEIDGCAVGVRSRSGDPILKPWRIAVSSPQMMQALDGLRCPGGHAHVPCAGRETARSAFYPEQLCNAIHDGLDAHESAHAAAALETHVKPLQALVPGSMSFSGEHKPAAETRVKPFEALVPGCTSDSGTHVKPLQALVPGSMSIPGECLPSAGSCIGADSAGVVDTCTGNQNPLTFSSAAVTVFDPESGHHNPLTFSSAAVTVCDPAGNQPSADFLDKPKTEIKKASVPGTPLFGPETDDPGWELYCLEHGMHALAQDDDESEPVYAHRPKCAMALGLFTAMVTRIIPSSAPEAKSEGCLKALLKETNKLRSRTVWDESLVEEWSTVRRQDPNATCGRVFSILGEKNAERHSPMGEREYKARIVFAGNAIQTASGVAPHELFQEVSSAPAAMASIRAVLAVSALRGWPTKARDAAQAYIQARIDGPGRPRTWVRLPKSWWPDSWFSENGDPKFWDPVCPLQRALYGHPESGAIWEKHLSMILEELGWERVAAHPGTWVHKKTLALLAVYVDDLLMTAPPSHEKGLWKALEERVNFDDEPAEIAKFLGAHHQLSKSGSLTTGKVQMREFLLDAVDRYLEETGEKSLAIARTPYLPENFSCKDGEDPGIHAKTCSSHLMKLLFAARLARPDLVVAITRLASKVTTWNKSHDRALRRLMQYTLHAADLELVGSLSSEDLGNAVLVMSPDADLAGDLETTKSTSGLWLELRSEDGKRCWPLSWRSKRQGSTASSTCEAEMISLATALKAEVLPMMELLERALARPVKLRCLEDNTQCLQAAEIGYSPALRHLPRTERIAVGVVHEIFMDGDGQHELVYQETSAHKGDMFTKRLDPCAFERALTLINLVRPDGTKYKAE